MKPQQVYDRRDQLQILDVREPYEWEAGHIAEAVHIPMGQLNARRDEIATDRTVVCVCRSGARSGQVAKALSRAGYAAHNMNGGMKAWNRRGLPLVSEDDRPARVA